MPFTDQQKEIAIDLHAQGKTQQEIGDALSIPRRTAMRLCKELGLKRSVKEAASLKIKSQLDNPDTISKIKELRSSHSLEEIAGKVGGSISAVQRICNRYNVEINSAAYATIQSARMQLAWTEEKKQKAAEKARDVSPDVIAFLSQNSKRKWADPEYRQKQIDVQTAFWNSPDNKRRLAEFRSIQSGKVSSIQNILYSMLDDLGVKYFRENNGKAADPECILGPFNYDCVVPRVGKRSLLIECQGDYWHTQEKAIRVDKSKSTYYERYLSNDYELKYIWEHEFSCHEKVLELLKYWLGLTSIEVVDYEFNQLEWRRPKAEEYRLLLAKYHYLPNAGKGGQAMGIYLDDVLVAICVFSDLVRQNIEIEGYSRSEVVELSRLCIHPRYQKKNLASWFISRCIKQLPDSIKCIISYCDTTFNHDGAVYKATGFSLDNIVRPDYWYSNVDGWVMHKKTLYNKAVKMQILESEYAEKFGYKKIFGKEKLRFKFVR